MTLFEFDRLGLRTVVPPQTATAFVLSVQTVCHVVWIAEATGADLLARAARLGHGKGLAMADAIILTSLLDAGARAVYTTDSVVGRYEGPVEIVAFNLSEDAGRSAPRVRFTASRWSRFSWRSSSTSGRPASTSRSVASRTI